MDKCLGIISTRDIDRHFGGLCKIRSSYMLPFGGRYRLIDFTISNMVNHDLKTIGLFTGPKIRSTMDHLGDGKPWDLNRRFSGLFLFPPSYDSKGISYKGDLPQFYNVMDFLDQVKERYILIANPNIIAKVDLKKALEHFLDSKADITLIYKEQDDAKGEMVGYGKIHLDEDGNFKNLGENLALERKFNHFLGMSFIKKDIFIEIVKDSMEMGSVDYYKEAIIEHKDKYKINTFKYDGYVEVIKDLKSFYDSNMNLLNREISMSIFFEGGPVWTKAKDEPSTLYTDDSNVQNSLIANGCIIEGEVKNSIIFRGVKIGKGAIIKNSVIMQKSEVGDNAIVVNTIMDKLTSVDKGVRITGSSLMPYVVEKYQKIRKD